MTDDELEELARKARWHIQCPDWPYPCSYSSCRKFNRCLFVKPLTDKEKAIEAASYKV